MIIAFVGAGGKTTLIHNCAQEYMQQGKKVFITTSTHMFIEDDTLLGGDADRIIRRMDETGCAMAGMPEGAKIVSLPEECYRKVCSHADVTLVEADGSKHMPLKFPSESEPVIYDNVDEIVVVCSLHALGKRICDAVHRPELAAKCLDTSSDTVICPVHVQKLIREGYLRPLKEKYPDKRLRVHAVHDGSLWQRAVAALLEADMDVSLIRREWFMPQPWMIICGGGHVSLHLAKMASSLDFRVKVLDDREEFASRERFPDADEVICDSFDHLENYLEPDSCCVVVTRGHKDDFLCVKTILQHSYRYLGMIGSKLKVGKTFDNLRAEGVSEEQLRTIHAPIGLSIGAVTPPEIAISILAEIIAEKNKTHVSSVSRDLLDCREQGMLCIIIEKTGSSPRGVGSMMFVGKARTLDSIGGGAVEFAAIEDARTCPQAAIREYHLNNRDSIRLGMICGGSNRILFLPV